MQTIYIQDLGGAKIDPLPQKGADCKMHFPESHACCCQLTGGMINYLPVDQLSLSEDYFS